MNSFFRHYQQILFFIFLFLSGASFSAEMDYPPIPSFSIPGVNNDVLNEGKHYDLDASDSVDDPRDPAEYRGIASYRWEQISGPSLQLTGINEKVAHVSVPENIGDVPEPFAVIRLSVTDKEGAVTVLDKKFRLNRTPFVEGNGFDRPVYVINEDDEHRVGDNPEITLQGIDDYDFDISSANEHLTINYTLTKLEGNDVPYTMSFDENDITVPLTFSTEDFTGNAKYKIQATITDGNGLEIQKEAIIKFNSLPTLELEGPSQIKERESGEVRILNLQESGEVSKITWRVEKNGVLFDQIHISPDDMVYSFVTGEGFQRTPVKFIVSVMDNDGGVVEYSFETKVNIKPYISITTALDSRPDGVYLVTDAQTIPISTGDWDNIDNNQELEGGTHDVDGYITDIKWELISNNAQYVSVEMTQPYDGTTPEYTGFRGMSVTLNKPGETYTWKVTVTDNDGAVNEGNVSIFVNTPPKMEEPKGSAISLRYKAEGFLEMPGVRDVDGKIVTTSWQQLSGPAVSFSDPDSPVTRFSSMAKLDGNDDKTFVFRAKIIDELGAETYKDFTVTATDVFNTCGNVDEDHDNPPGGDCHRDESLGYGVINDNTCPSQVSQLWIPSSLDSPGVRSQLLSDCNLRHEYECKSCLEPLSEGAGKYVECALMPYMLPPKMQAYKISEDGKSLVETDVAPKDSNFGQPINQPEKINPDSQWELWGADSLEDYERMYKDREKYPATRCLDVTKHLFWMNNDINSGLSFEDTPDADPNADVTPLNNFPCWNWDLQYRCFEKAVNTCSDWEDANDFSGNLNNVPPEWHFKGATDVVVDNYLYWLHNPNGPMPKNNAFGIPQESIMTGIFHYSANERWDIQCKNSVTGEVNKKISETFCEKNPDGTVNLLRCKPSGNVNLIDLGAMPLDENEEVIEDPSQGPYFKCLHHNKKPATRCQYNTVNEMMDSLRDLDHFEFDGKTQVTYEKADLFANAMCVEDLNDDGTAIMNIMDDPNSFSGDWDDPSTSEKDECYEWESKWLFFSGKKFQWCTLNCSDGSTGVKQELVGCGLIDESAEPIPEWEQWGKGWSQCVEPVIKTICPADATIDITKNGAPATAKEVEGLNCTSPLSIEDKTKTGEVVHSEEVMSCEDPNAAVITCMPDPNCELTSVTPAGLENGVHTQQLQEYICKKVRNVCEKKVMTTECSPPDDFTYVDDEPSSFAKAAAASKMIDATAGNVEYKNGELHIFSGSSIKCTYLTDEAMGLYDILQSAISGVIGYMTGGTGGWIIAGIGATELLSSQEFLHQMGNCCERNPAVVEKKVSMASLLTSTINTLLGGEQQAKVPVCTGDEIRLAYARSSDSHGGHIFSGTEGGYYYEGSAFIKKPFGNLGTFKDLEISLGPLLKVTIMKGQKWCVFDNIIARIIQIGAREQLKAMTVNSASSGNLGATKVTEHFKFFGSSNQDYGWKMVDSNLNGSKMMAYEWSPECGTPDGQEKAMKGQLVCPIDPEDVWTAYCSGSACDPRDLQGATDSPTDDRNPNRGVTMHWDVQNIRYDDDSVFALTQFIVKQGVCDYNNKTCSWDMFTWPAGGAASTVSFDMDPLVYGDPEMFGDSSQKSGWGEEYGTDKYKFFFKTYAPGEDWPSTMSLKIQPLTGANENEETVVDNIPMTISNVEGFDLPIDGMKLYGGCDQETSSCHYTIKVPVTISAIPEDSCEGLTPEQLMVIDFSKIDFGEYAEALAARATETSIDPDVMLSLAKTAIGSFTEDVKNGNNIADSTVVDVGTFKSTNFVGPQIDMIQVSQEMPFNQGFVEELDIDWGDGSSDHGITFTSMLEKWGERYNEAKGNHDNVCIPSFRNYVNELNTAEAEKDDRWDTFIQCVERGNVGPIYTVADLTDNDISRCAEPYGAYNLANEEYKKYSCGEKFDKMSRLMLCINSSGKGIVVSDSDISSDLASQAGCSAEYNSWRSYQLDGGLTDSSSNIGTCGEEGHTGRDVYIACASKLKETKAALDRYKDHHQSLIDNGQNVIEYEHFWPSLSEEEYKDFDVTITGKVYSQRGNPGSGILNTITLKGKVRDWSGHRGGGEGTHQIQFKKPGPERAADDPTIGNSSVRKGQLPDPNPDGSIDSFINDLKE